MCYKIFSDGVNIGTNIIDFSPLCTKVWYTKSKTPVTNPIQKMLFFNVNYPSKTLPGQWKLILITLMASSKKSDFLTNLG